MGRHMKLIKLLTGKFLLGIFAILCMQTAVDAQEKFDNWLKKEQQKLQDYKDERDRQFGRFLEREWRQMQLMRGIKIDKTPKPVTTPVAEKKQPEPTPAKTPPPIKVIESKPPAPVIEPKPVLPDIPDRVRTVKFHYFNTPVAFPHPEKFKLNKRGRYDKQDIASFWQTMSKSDYEPYVTTAKQYKDRLALNDWAYCVFLKKLAGQIFPRSQAQQKLFIWFILIKSGYDARVGYSNEIHILLPSVGTIFSVPYFTIENRRYYVVPFDEIPQRPMALTTYDGRYPGADKAIDLRLNSLPKLQFSDRIRKLKFEYGGQAWALNIHFNDNLIDFLRYYPQTELEIYFNAQASLSVQQAMLQNLRPVVQGKSETEAVNILLRFVQTAFAYKTDQDQFDREKYFFPIETVNYPFSDCEDRAILFAFLVRNLLKLQVVALDYPGHVATAVHFTEKADGAYVVYGGKKYTICDPTYVNALLGRTLPKLKNVQPKILKINS